MGGTIRILEYEYGRDMQLRMQALQRRGFNFRERMFIERQVKAGTDLYMVVRYVNYLKAKKSTQRKDSSD